MPGRAAISSGRPGGRRRRGARQAAAGDMRSGDWGRAPGSGAGIAMGRAVSWRGLRRWEDVRMGATIYIAGPLFSMAERRFNRALADGLRKAMPGCEVILPQDFKPHGRYNDPRTFGAIFRECVDGVGRADVVVAVLDGEDVDSGTAFEMGLAYQKGTPIVGVRTDFRSNQECGVNIMISRACARMPRVLSFGEDIDAAVAAVARAVRKILAQTESRNGSAGREGRANGAAAR